MKARSIFLLAAVAVMSLAAACNKHEVVNHGRGNGRDDNEKPSQPTTPTYTFELKENKTWNIGYLGRQDYQENDGTTIRVDAIDVSGIDGGGSYLVSVISRDNYSSYSGDVAQFLKDEAQYNNEYVYTDRYQTIYFDPFRHGTWYGFIIGLNPDKSASGEYAYAKFEVVEEEPNEAYLKWIGSWNVSDGKGIFYPLVVSQLEANYIYRVDGWETGSSIGRDGTVMDQEYLETFYDAPSGSMFFTSQYIQTYTDDNLGEMEECFLGQIDYDGITEEMGLYIITDEGLDLAEARFSGDGQSAQLLPCSVRAQVGNDTFESNFYNMQYFGWATAKEQWYPYNDNVPSLPMTMVRSEGGNGGGNGDNPPAPKVGRRNVSAPAMPARAKVHVSKADRPAAKAVRVR